MSALMSLRLAKCGWYVLLFAAIMSRVSRAAETMPAGEPNASTQPNIVFILADDLGYGDIQTYNPKKGKIPTPNVDRLAADGMRFTDCHSPSSVCSPTRYGLLTGRYAWRSRLQKGVLQPFDPPLIAANRLTWPAVMRKHGYTTACIGKWHLGRQWPKRNGEYVFDGPIPEGPTTRGFDYYFGTDVPNFPPYCFIENDRTVGQPTGHRAKKDQNGPPGAELPGWSREAILPTLVEKSVEYIAQRAKDRKQFFLYVPLTSPHQPVAPSAQFLGKSGISKVADFIMETDWAAGQVIDALDRHGLRENTIVVFTADNGRSTATEPKLAAGGNVKGHYPCWPWRGFKTDAWEGGHRVPMVIRWPKRVRGGSTSDALVCLVDWMATAADLLDEKLPDNVGEDSISFLPTLLGKKTNKRDTVVLHSIYGRFAVRQGQWKLILCPGSGGYGGPPSDKTATKQGLPPVQLYDLQADPAEKRNLQAEQPEKVKELTVLLQRIVENGRSTLGPSQENDVDISWRPEVATMKPQSASSSPAAQTQPADWQSKHRRLIERVRRQPSAKAPAWVNAIPDRIADILIEKHLYKDGEYWGLAKALPEQKLPFDEIGTSRFIGLAYEYKLFDRVGKPDDAVRAKALRYWQSWQDPRTGRFIDPRDSKRVVNEKYVVGVIGGLGGKPLYPWTTTGDSGKVETTAFLKRTQSDPDWAEGGWGVGSQTGFQALQIFDAINAGQTEFIPDLAKGIEQLLSHQDSADGLWGPPSAGLMKRIGGTLKVVGRLYFRMGMRVPHTRELADSLIEHSRNGNWYKNGQNDCVPRNVAEVAAYCIEVSDYRRDELLQVLDKLVEDYQSWVLPDGRTLARRGKMDSVGQNSITIYGLGLIGAYLNWEDCRLPNPLADARRGEGYRYRPVLRDNGKVEMIDTEKDRSH